MLASSHFKESDVLVPIYSRLFNSIPNLRATDNDSQSRRFLLLFLIASFGFVCDVRYVDAGFDIVLFSTSDGIWREEPPRINIAALNLILLSALTNITSTVKIAGGRFLIILDLLYGKWYINSILVSLDG